MQAKQENGISMISREEKQEKQFKQGRQFRMDIVCTVLAYGLLTVRRKFS